MIALRDLRRKPQRRIDACDFRAGGAASAQNVADSSR
jgi:hypothetical protein